MYPSVNLVSFCLSCLSCLSCLFQSDPGDNEANTTLEPPVGFKLMCSSRIIIDDVHDVLNVQGHGGRRG